jgi:uncharacterized protein (DUF2164 family)
LVDGRLFLMSITYEYGKEEISMWETISNMMTDRIWIYTGIIGSIFGALFVAYMRDTRISLWLYGKWDFFLDYIRESFGWTWFNQDVDAWKKVNPNIAKKMDQLEERLRELEQWFEGDGK